MTTAIGSLKFPTAGDNIPFPQNGGDNIKALNGGNPPGVMLNWNNSLTECSIEATSGQFKSYGKVSFPIEECGVTFSQDLVQHKRPNVAGARVEGTGFNPIMFKVKALFLFGLQRGNGETWANLYPEVFQKVFSILTDTVSPVLIFTHPTMGQFTVKPQNGTTNVSSNQRNGQVIEFELIQANENENATITIPVQNLSAAEGAATIFDDTFQLLKPPPPPHILAISLTKLLQKVRGVIDSTSLFIGKLTNVVNYAINQIKMIEDALIRLKTAATSGLMTQLKRVKAGIFSLINNRATVRPIGINGQVRANSTVPPPANPTATPTAAIRAAQLDRCQALNSAKNVAGITAAGNLSVYAVTAEMTLSNIALLTSNTIEQILRLNPNAGKSPTVKIGTQIVYQKVAGPSPRQ